MHTLNHAASTDYLHHPSCFDAMLFLESRINRIIIGATSSTLTSLALTNILASDPRNLLRHRWGLKHLLRLHGRAHVTKYYCIITAQSHEILLHHYRAISRNSPRCRGGLKQLRPHGRGRATWPDGEEYRGQWWMGEPEGHGQAKVPSGEVYVGETNNLCPFLVLGRW